MQTYVLPIKFIKLSEQRSRKFLWNKVDRSRYIARTSWSNITRTLGLGGLGIRRLRDWNIAFMAKLGWKLLTGQDKLWIKIF